MMPAIMSAPLSSTADAQPSALAAVDAPSAVRWSRALVIVCLIALALLCAAWELWLAPVRPGGSWLALKALPLLFALPGLVRHRLYTYRWLSLMVWLYFCEGIVRATSEPAPGAWLAVLEVVLCLLLFAACVRYVRLRLKSRG